MGFSMHYAGLSTDLSPSRPADILVQEFDQGKPAAFDISVVSPLNSNVLSAAGARAGAASEAAKHRKHTANDAKCAELGWVGLHPSCGGVLWGMGQGSSAIFF